MGCADSSDSTQGADSSSVQEADESGRTQLIVGFDAEYPPYGYMDDSGEYTGFDLELAQAVCDMEGWELVKQPIDWGSKDEELGSGQIDCIWNGFAYTEERAQTMALSDVYIKGEISNCKYHYTGHIYFSVKDETSVISAVMFSQDAGKLAFRMKDGMKAVFYGIEDFIFFVEIEATFA